MMRANRLRELKHMRETGTPFYWRGQSEMGAWMRKRGYLQQYCGSSEWRISLAGMAAVVTASREYDAKGRLPEVFSSGVAPR